MKQVFIFLIIIIVTNVSGQSFEDKAAKLSCDCLKEIKQIDNEKYRECITSSMARLIKNGESFKDWTVEGIQNTYLKVDSIVSLICVLLSEKELKEKRIFFYADSKDKLVQSSYSIGNEMMSKRKFNLAIEKYHLALSTDSTFVPALDNTASCYKQLGDFENAIHYYYKSLTVYPEGEFALTNIGVIYTALSEFEISNFYYRRLTNLYPNNPEGYFGLAKNYILLGEFKNGLENISVAYKIYKKMKSYYIQDAVSIIEVIRQAMKETNQDGEFKKLAKKYGLKIK